MPGCSENYQGEIENGRNLRSVKCKYCNSVVLTPNSADFETIEVRKTFALYFKIRIYQFLFSV